MASTALQVSLKFSQYASTWSENFWSLWSGSAQSLVDNLLLAGQVNTIAGFRHPATVYQGVSVRSSTSTRNAAIGYTQLNPASSLSSSSPGADLTQTSLPVRYNAPGGGGRTLFVRGLPDGSTLRNPITGRTNFSAIQSALTAYAEMIRVFGAGAIQHLVPAPNSGVGSWQNVTQIGPATDNPSWTEITLIGASIIPAAGVTVYLRGFQNGTFTWLRGHFVVKSNPAGNNSFTVPATWRGGATPVKVSNVQARQFQYSYDAMSGFTLGQLTSRKTNDPIVRRRGRRSPVTRRRLGLVAS